MCQTAAKESQRSKICRSLSAYSDHAAIVADRALVAAIPVTATPSLSGSCTRSVPFCVTAPATLSLTTPDTIAPIVSSISASTCPIWLRPAVTTPTGSSTLRFVSSSRMVFPTALPVGTSGATIVSSSPTPPSRTGSRPPGGKILATLSGPYLDEALADFSGYLVVDELYDGPFCVLSAVDGPQQRRLLYEVLDHNPTHEDILFFLARVLDQIRLRGKAVQGITTDASSLYPVPLALLFPGIRHQVCEFHIIKELTKAVLGILARQRKRLAEQKPKLPRGRPSKSEAAQELLSQAKAIEERISVLFENRYLFVRHQLTAAERVLLQELIGTDELLRVLRQIMDEVYRLFDRRCRTDTALKKLSKLRRRVRRYRSLGTGLDKLYSPNLEKALTFLDDKLLPATSNAVERGNRRYRKMQKSVYRVRKQEAVQGRLALDLQRDQQADGRQSTLDSLHRTRN